jgi:hypothetical protein
VVATTSAAVVVVVVVVVVNDAATPSRAWRRLLSGGMGRFKRWFAILLLRLVMESDDESADNDSDVVIVVVNGRCTSSFSVAAAVGIETGKVGRWGDDTNKVMMLGEDLAAFLLLLLPWCGLPHVVAGATMAPPPMTNNRLLCGKL